MTFDDVPEHYDNGQAWAYLDGYNAARQEDTELIDRLVTFINSFNIALAGDLRDKLHERLKDAAD